MRTVPSRRGNKNVPSSAVEKKKYRPFPSWKKLYTVPSRRAKSYEPSRPTENKKTTSRPVVIIFIFRPVPSWQFYIPSRPVVTIFIYRPVSSWNKKAIVMYRSVPSKKSTPTVPFRSIQATTSKYLFFLLLGNLPHYTSTWCESNNNVAVRMYVCVPSGGINFFLSTAS